MRSIRRRRAWAASIGCVASVAAGLREQGFSQFPGVAQAEVETLAGDRVQALRGIADPHLTLVR
jgi:hypothetical protein